MNLNVFKSLQRYPRQFSLMFWGMMISTIGSSMIWPFLMIYVSERLKLPLGTVTILLTINASCGLVASFLAGPVADKIGRKWIMVISLASNGLLYLFMSQANSLPAFMVLMGLTGAVNPLYRVGTDAMVADLIPREQRQLQALAQIDGQERPDHAGANRADQHTAEKQPELARILARRCAETLKHKFPLCQNITRQAFRKV